MKLFKFNIAGHLETLEPAANKEEQGGFIQWATDEVERAFLEGFNYQGELQGKTYHIEEPKHD